MLEFKEAVKEGDGGRLIELSKTALLTLQDKWLSKKGPSGNSERWYKEIISAASWGACPSGNCTSREPWVVSLDADSAPG